MKVMRRYKKYLILGIFLFILEEFSFSKEDLSFRRIHQIRPSFSIFTSDGQKIALEYRQFPDGEHYIRLLNPSAVRNESIKFYASLSSADDFVKILLTLGTLKQYGAEEISLVLKGWVPFSEEDYLLVSFFRNFAKEVIISPYLNTQNEYPLPIEPLIPQKKIRDPIHIDYLVYLQPRFKESLENAIPHLKEAESAFIEVKQTFPGHWKVHLMEDIAEKNVVIVHSTESSENILALILTISLLRAKGVRSISLINTYQGYSRQDKEFQEGEGVASYTLLEVLNQLLDNNLSINVHYGKKSGSVFLSPQIWITDENGNRQIIAILPAQEIYNLNGFVQLAEGLKEEIRKKEGEEVLKKHPFLIISPDDGGFLYAKEAAEVLRERHGINVIAGYLNKERLSATEVVLTGDILGEDGKTILFSNLEEYYIFILDDETSTGSTIKSAVYHLVENLGADFAKIYAGVVHGKFSLGLEEFYTLKGKELLPQLLVTLDTLAVPEGIKTISSAALISFCIKRILGGGRVVSNR